MGSRRDIGESFVELVEIMAKLRAPGGCPWDRKQSLESLKEYVLEEAYELIDAIDSKDRGNICEECGEVMVERYARIKNGKTVCIPCSEKSA